MAYVEQRKADLVTIATERQINVEGLTKAEIVAALEAHDASLSIPVGATTITEVNETVTSTSAIGATASEVLPWCCECESPTPLRFSKCKVWAVNAEKAREKFLRRNGVVDTDHPVTITPCTGEEEGGCCDDESVQQLDSDDGDADADEDSGESTGTN